jgi:hypothetical protein
MVLSLYSCQYGTWMGNNHRERQAVFTNNTVSFWTSHTQCDYLNPFYEPCNLIRLTRVAKPAYFELTLWKELYFRHAENVEHGVR